MRLALDLAPLDAAAILADDAGTQRALVRHAISRENLNREGTPAASLSVGARLLPQLERSLGECCEPRKE